MIVTIDKAALQAALSTVAKAAAAGSSMAVLNGVLLRAEEGRLTMETTDLVSSVRRSVAANTQEAGACVLPAKMLLSIVKELPQGPVTLDGPGATVALTSGRSIRYMLSALPAANFPAFPQVAPESSAELPRATLARLVGATWRCVSKDTARAALCGLQLTVASGLVRLVACDSYRLAVAEAACGPGELSAIVPAAPFRDALAALEADDEVTVGLSGSQVTLQGGSQTWVFRRIEGGYPDWPRLLPSSHATDLPMDARALARALAQVSLLASDNPAVRLDVDPDGRLATFGAFSKDAGEARASVEAEPTGDPCCVALNHRYLEDCLTAVADLESPVMELNGPMRPVVVKASGEVSYTGLIMPVHL